MFKYVLKKNKRIVHTYYQHERPTAQQVAIYKPPNEKNWKLTKHFCPKHEAYIATWKHPPVGHTPQPWEIMLVDDRYAFDSMKNKVRYILNMSAYVVWRKMRFWTERYLTSTKGLKGKFRTFRL